MLLAYTLVFAFILCLIALAGCFSEHSGIINIGLEGIMVVSALAGALIMHFLYPAIKDFPNWLRALSIIVASGSASILIGMLYSTLLGIAAIHFKSDQILIGTAMNLLGVAFASVIATSVNLSFTGKASYEIEYIQPRKSFILNINGFEFNWFILITIVILVASYVVLYKTRFGLRLIACGENPHASCICGYQCFKNEVVWCSYLRCLIRFSRTQLYNCRYKSM